MSSSSKNSPVRYLCGTIEPSRPGVRRVSETQEKVEGWDQPAFGRSVALDIGAGGIGSWVGLNLVKQGIGQLHITDPDLVDPSNLNRQLFLGDQLYETKGPALARVLAVLGYLGTTVSGYPLYFSEFVQDGPGLVPDVGVVGVDNDKARAQACAWFLHINRPLVCVGIARDADGGYTFVQEPQKACLGCYLGELLLRDSGNPCPGAPAVIDVLQVMGGFAAFAVGTLIMKRPRRWNVVRLSLAAGQVRPGIVERRSDCPFCGTNGTRGVR